MTTQFQIPPGISYIDSPGYVPPRFRRPCGSLRGRGGPGGGASGWDTTKVDSSKCGDCESWTWRSLKVLGVFSGNGGVAFDLWGRWGGLARCVNAGGTGDWSTNQGRAEVVEYERAKRSTRHPSRCIVLRTLVTLPISVTRHLALSRVTNFWLSIPTATAMGVRSGVVVCVTSFLLGQSLHTTRIHDTQLKAGSLFTHWIADSLTLWKSPVTDEHLWTAASYYSILAKGPPETLYFLAAVVFIGGITILWSLRDGEAGNIMFDGGSICKLLSTSQPTTTTKSLCQFYSPRVSLCISFPYFLVRILYSSFLRLLTPACGLSSRSRCKIHLSSYTSTPGSVSPHIASCNPRACFE